VSGATARAVADAGSSEAEWAAAVRANAADPDKGLFRGAGSPRLAADDRDLPPPAYLRHDLGAELVGPGPHDTPATS